MKFDHVLTFRGFVNHDVSYPSPAVPTKNIGDVIGVGFKVEQHRGDQLFASRAGTVVSSDFEDCVESGIERHWPADASIALGALLNAFIEVELLRFFRGHFGKSHYAGGVQLLSSY